MDAGAVIALSLAGTTSLAAIGMSVYALVLRSRLASATTDRNAAIDARIAALAELVHASEEIKGLRAQLRDAQLQKGQLYERLAKAGLGGAGDLVDDHIRRLYPDADSASADGDGAGPLPDRGAAAAADAGEGDLSEVAPRQPRDRDLL